MEGFGGEWGAGGVERDERRRTRMRTRRSLKAACTKSGYIHMVGRLLAMYSVEQDVSIKKYGLKRFYETWIILTLPIVYF